MVDNDLMIILLLVVLVIFVWRSHRETSARLDVIDARLKDLTDAVRRWAARRGGE